jgi:hypothetical protein
LRNAFSDSQIILHDFPNGRYLISVLSIVPPKKRPELCDQALALSENQIEVLRSGIIDKTAMNEAVDDLGMKYAIGVKYPLSLFTIITVSNIAYS